MTKKVVNIARRGFLVGCALLLAGCAQPKLTGEDSANISIVSVTVTSASMENAATGRPNEITKARLESDLTNLLTHNLVGRAGTVKADLTVDVKEINLIPRGASALLPLQSTGKAVISVTESETGRILITPTEFTAVSTRLRAGGLIGVATAPTVEVDFVGTVNGLANAVGKRIYGKE